MSTYLVAVGFLALLVSARAETPMFKKPTDDELLGRQVQGMNPAAGPIDRVLSAVLGAAGVPGGIAVQAGCNAEPVTLVRVSGPTLRDGLQAIVKIYPLYRWNVEDGVVNLIPSTGLPALLSVQIPEFDSKEATNPTSAASLLFRLPEVQRAKSELGLSDGPNPIQLGIHDTAPLPSSGPKLERALGVQSANLTIRQGLNAIVRTNGHGIWVYRERHCGNSKSFNVSFSD